MSQTFAQINLLFLFVVIMLSGCNEVEPNASVFDEIQFPNENALSWDYPVKPGSEKWKTFQTGMEMVEACQIPKSVLSGLSTEELLLICLKFPLLFDIGAANFFSDGYAAYENNFNGIREFYQRGDAPTVIYNYYRQLKPENARIYSSIFFVFRISVVEYILSAPSVISKYSTQQRKEVATELNSKLNLKKYQTDDFPHNYLNSTYRALITIIKSDSNGNLSSDDTKLAGYFTGVGLPPEKVLKQVEEIIASYFSSK